MKKIILSLFISLFITTNVFAAGSSSSGSSGNDGGSSATKTNYEKAILLVKSAKKYEKKGKLEKAKKSYTKAQKLLIKSNEKKPGKADTLNYLGFTTRKLGDFENGEKYYLQGLAIDPKHKGINEYLGELYVATNRHNLAVERLEVLKGCSCEEYDQLKAVIAGEKSKY
jgi:tetratricopeptide (TPR) repeat protein